MANREEVINVRLAELLDKRGLITIPENTMKTISGRKMPDILIGVYEGIIINPEGKYDTPQGRKEVERQCKGRINDGIANMSIAVCYPPELANVKFQDLPKELEASEFAIKIFSVSGKNSPGTMDWYNDTSDEGFQNCSVNDLARVIKDAYNELISDKTIQNNVKLIDSTIDSCVEKLSNQTGAVARLEKIVTIAFDGEEDSEEEDGKEKI